ncbi:MAG TPA: polyphosphate:AMP phosphotransferase [Polyangiaceae bacterium]|jgi:polyphosphate:AMP phosphotransferase|nr:polyphosphate:AMP phosphotransferase [Polyangiaceae bacterium]
MLKSAELGRALSKEDYDAAVPDLRTSLLKAQTELEHAKFPVIVLINGADGAGKSETLNTLHEWFDARYLHSEAYEAPSEEERERPEFWRYWMWLPKAGRIGIFLGSWYTQPILDLVREGGKARKFEQSLARINAFERTLTDDGALFIKLWFHVSKKVQKKRLDAAEKAKNTRFLVTKSEWENHRHYDDFIGVTERVLRETSTGQAPWTVIEAGDDNYRNVTAGLTILERIQHRLATRAVSDTPRPEPEIADPVTLLDRLDLSRRLDKAEYEAKLIDYQGKLGKLAQKLKKKKRSAIFLFEGSDAAGKGGAIRRLVWALDARQYRIIPVSAPSDEERAHHYLWRFFRHVPRRGRITIYDRSWYGRVLVERVEGFASEDAVARAYKEINDFEEELVRDGIVLLKFWLQISPEEQLRRFQDREREPWKQHKITAEDYRNRRKTHQYESAASEMIARNSTEYAPFTLVEAEDKHYARIKVLETVCERLERELG